MTAKLNAREREIVDFCRRWTETHGVFPRRSEIADRFGWTMKDMGLTLASLNRRRVIRWGVSLAPERCEVLEQRKGVANG